MKRLSAAVFAFALASMSSGADAGVIAGKLTKMDGGVSSMILLSDEDSRNCDREFPGSKFAALKLANSRTAQVLQQYPGCYAMRGKGEIAVSFWDATSSQWVSYTMQESSFEKSARFTGWPSAPKGFASNYEQEADQLMDAMIDYENEKAR